MNEQLFLLRYMVQNMHLFGVYAFRSTPCLELRNNFDLTNKQGLRRSNSLDFNEQDNLYNVIYFYPSLQSFFSVRRFAWPIN